MKTASPIVFPVVVLLFLAQSILAGMQVRDLRCEYLIDPLGIDIRQPGLSWKLSSRERAQRQNAYQILAATTMDPLSRNQGDLWDSGRVAGSPTTPIPYQGRPLHSRMICWWKVRVWDQEDHPSDWSPIARWTMGLLDSAEWQARWIAAPLPETDTRSPSEGKVAQKTVPLPAPLFRKSFEVNKAVRRALLFVCGLGFHEVHLNGGKVGQAVLEPGWTNYRQRCLYETLEVTRHIRRGTNALAVLLGNGMYHVPGGRYTKFKGSFGEPKLILQLYMEFGDNSSMIIGSDASWKVTSSPILFNCIFGGEDYDSQKEIPNWNQAEGDDSQWPQARIVVEPGGVLSSQNSPASRIMQTFPTVRVTQPATGIFIYDLGRNFSGWPMLTVQGPRGATVKMTPGELLDEKGFVSQRSSGGPMWFSYTLKGKGVEAWHPRFCYYGFRYVQVEGALPASLKSTDRTLPRIRSLQGHFVHSSAEIAGEFSSSHGLLNQIHSLILAAIRSNLQSVLTDCPHREKLGWLEVSHLLGSAMMFNFDLPRFFTKIINDMQEAQLPNGMVPDIAPEFTVFQAGFRDSPEWGSAYIIDPWLAYQMYGDLRLLEKHYEGMKRYLDYLQSRSQDHILTHGLGDWYDIGPKPPGVSQLTSPGVTATSIYYQDAVILKKIATLLERKEEARQYTEWADRIKNAFNRRFFRESSGTYDRNSQTANAMPLVLGLTDDSHRIRVLNQLARAVEESGYRVTAGDVGFHYLVRALSGEDRDDLLFRLSTQREGPGYAYQLARGATTLTEAWDANPTSSQNHCMLGHVEEWFYRGLGGLQIDESSPGFRHFILKPKLVEKVDWIKVRYNSVRGTILSEWQQGIQQTKFTFSIPADTTAVVYLPAGNIQTIKESGRAVQQSKGVRFLRMEDSTAVFEIGSGIYHFVSKKQNPN